VAKMTEHSKAVANRAAREMSNTAAFLAGAAAGCFFLPPGGPMAGAVLGIASAVAWYMSNEYGGLANDPPRDDFEMVSIFKETPESFNLKAPSNDFESTWQYIVRNQILIVGALHEVVISFERSAGISEVEEKASVQKKDQLQSYKAIQDEAIKHNMMACIQLHNDLLRYSPRANLEWYNLRKELLKASEKRHSESKSAKKNFSNLWNEKIRPKLGQYRLDHFGISDFTDYLEFIDQQDVPSELPNILLGTEWYENRESISSELLNISKTL
jgi:hypothetical protein